MAALAQNALEVACPGCGAEVSFCPPQVAGDCPFCATHIVAQPQAANPVITPEGILPFKIDAKAAGQRLSQWLKSRWFAPDGLKHLAQRQGLQGVYLPFWTYDCQTATRYTGERGTYYYIDKTRRVKNNQGEWVQETYQERHTRWHRVSGQVQRFFDDLLIPGGTSVNLEHLKRLTPWSLKQLTPYDPTFLTGFRAQRYQVDLNQGFEQAKQQMAVQIEADIRGDIGGDEQRISTQSTTYQDKSFKHLLLPVWIAAYRYQNRPYQVLINGESGKVVGERPFSKVKIALAVGAAVVAIATLLYLLNAHNNNTPESLLPPISSPTA